MNDMTTIMQTIEQAGAALEIVDQKIDTSTAAGKAFLQMLGVFAEFETNLRAERQKLGIAAAKEKGVYKKGKNAPRKKKVDKEVVFEMFARKVKAQTIADELGVSKTTIDRLRPEYKQRLAAQQDTTTE